MSYFLKLREDVLREIVEWGLSRHVMREILDGFDRVSQNPGRHLIRVAPPDDAMQFDLEIHDPGEPPGAYLFVFSVQYHADEETLVIFNCEHIFQSQPPEG